MVQFPDPAQSPFRRQGQSLAVGKFADPVRTADGQQRAYVPLSNLTTLWFNTGTLCNLACAGCYIESSPTNDALVYITTEEVEVYLDEIARDGIKTDVIGFTGGEPFMNKDMMPILWSTLRRGLKVLMLTNAMRPMRRFEEDLIKLQAEHGDDIVMRVSLDHYTQDAHEGERGDDTWHKALDGVKWLGEHGFQVAIAGRQLAEESTEDAKQGYDRLMKAIGVPIDVNDPEQLVLFPEMDATLDTPEITEQCWTTLNMPKETVMCSTSRMVVKRKGEATPRVAACTLLPYDPQFDLGETLKEASQAVKLNHPHCSRFCVLGGASCSG